MRPGDRVRLNDEAFNYPVYRTLSIAGYELLRSLRGRIVIVRDDPDDSEPGIVVAWSDGTRSTVERCVIEAAPASEADLTPLPGDSIPGGFDEGWSRALDSATTRVRALACRQRDLGMDLEARALEQAATRLHGLRRKLSDD